MIWLPLAPPHYRFVLPPGFPQIRPIAHRMVSFLVPKTDPLKGRLNNLSDPDAEVCYRIRDLHYGVMLVERRASE